jgi:hypothetical protein
MHGLYPDHGLTKDKKMKNTLSDGEHVGMASYCNALLSADEKLCRKARSLGGRRIVKHLKRSQTASVILNACNNAYVGGGV